MHSAARDRASIEGDGPLVRGEEPGDDPQHGGLAAARGSQHAHDRPVGYDEVDAGQHRRSAVRLREAGDGDVAHGCTPRRACRLSRNVAGIETSTSSSAYGAAAPYCTEEAFDQNSVAKVLYPSGDSNNVAVSSVETARKTRAAPAPRPGLSNGRVTRQAVAQGPSPRLRDTSSRTGGAC